MEDRRVRVELTGTAEYDTDLGILKLRQRSGNEVRVKNAIPVEKKDEGRRGGPPASVAAEGRGRTVWAYDDHSRPSLTRDTRAVVA
jgi:hypothetical protein